MRHQIDNQYHYGVVYNLNGEIVGFNLSPDIFVPLTDDYIEKALEYYIKLHCPLEDEQGKKMSREEAIEQLEYTILLIVQDGKDYMDERDIPILKMAIQALKQQPCEDAISKKAVLHLIANYDLNMGQVVDGVHALPPVTPQLKIGKWVKVHPLQADDKGAYMCSRCKVGDWNLKGTENFCPNCGARMKEVEE